MRCDYRGRSSSSYLNISREVTNNERHDSNERGHLSDKLIAVSIVAEWIMPAFSLPEDSDQQNTFRVTVHLDQFFLEANFHKFIL